MSNINYNLRYEVLGKSGFQAFQGIRKVVKSFYYKITFESGQTLKASARHRFFLEDGTEIFAEKLKKDVKILARNGKLDVVRKIEKVNEPCVMYDVVQSKDHTYYTGNSLSHNCDCNFLASGDTVFEFADLEFFEKTYMCDPVERRGEGGNYWIWERPDYSRSYLLSADVARGDGTDYSAFHVWDVETCAQVAEYKGRMTPKDYGAFLVAAATEYNNALLVCENANIGWASIEEILSRGYQNTYYSVSSGGTKVETADSYASKMDKGKLVPGFTTSTRTRPLVVAKLYDYVHQRDCILRSKRLLTEMRTFIWKSGKAQAQEGLNDDVVMSAGIGLYVRDTALQLRQQGLELSRAQLTTFGDLNKKKPVVYRPNYFNNPYEVSTGEGRTEDISWVLG